MTSYRRLAAAAGVAAVWLGAVLTAGGPGAVTATAAASVRRIGVLLVVAAVCLLITNIAPHGTLVGPVAVMVVGLLIAAVQRHWLTSRADWTVIGLLISIGGATVAFRSAHEARSPEPLRRIVGVLGRRLVKYRPGDAAPAQLRLVAVGCRIDIDLRAASLPELGDVVEIVVTSIWGTTEVAIPETWPVVAGRVAGARHLRLEGVLDSDVSFDDPDADNDMMVGESQRDALSRLIEQRQQTTGSAVGGAAVVIHVMGWGGSLTIKRS